jgi:hypothetical protein
MELALSAAVSPVFCTLPFDFETERAGGGKMEEKAIESVILSLNYLDSTFTTHPNLKMEEKGNVLLKKM